MRGCALRASVYVAGLAGGAGVRTGKRVAMAALALLVLALEHGLRAAASPPPAPLPPRQSSMQAHIFAEHAAEAAKASPLATPAVLAAFADPAFAAVLQARCPDVAKLSPSALLEEFRAQMQLTEIVHNFHPTVNTNGSDHRPNSADVTLAALRQANYLYNMWELAPLHLTNVTYIEGWIGMSAKMETGLLRYPPFSTPNAPSGKPFPYGGWPADWSEASQVSPSLLAICG